MTAGIAGSNPSEGMDVCPLYCVGSGLCVELILLSQEIYSVCVCVRVSNCV